jgi:malate dehydrogenase (oxaloacetate-decarboxylating)
MEDKVLEMHKKHTGVLSIQPNINVTNSQDLANAYTPGVAEISLLIEKDHDLAREYTVSGKLVAVVTDGSAVLGLGNIGSQAGLPIVEGKSLLYKTLAGVDAIPLTLEQRPADEVVQTLRNLQNSFGGIHLEDIAAPACFEIEEKLQAQLQIPVYHDDQEGTAMVVLAGLINAAQLAHKRLEELSVVITGIGAAGVATAKLLNFVGISDITLVDKQGILTAADATLNRYQAQLVKAINRPQTPGTLADAISDKDVFIGLSDKHLLTADMVQQMATDPIIFALANPVPEIEPQEARKGGAHLIATGSSKHPNQVNNILVFPGLFKGLLAAKTKKVTLQLEYLVAKRLANMVSEPTIDKFIPQVFDQGVVETVEQAVLDYEQSSKKVEVVS